MRTKREQNVEQVAHIIRHRDYSNDDIHRINRKQGWTFDVRYDTHEYINDTDWTRVRNVQLDKDDLTNAVTLASN